MMFTGVEAADRVQDFISMRTVLDHTQHERRKIDAGGDQRTQTGKDGEIPFQEFETTAAFDNDRVRSFELDKQREHFVEEFFVVENDDQ